MEQLDTLDLEMFERRQKSSMSLSLVISQLMLTLRKKKHMFLILFLAFASRFVLRGYLGVQAFLFAAPLVVMNVTRTNLNANFGPDNCLRRMRTFPDHTFRDVVKPNVDTLYTTVFISLDQPYVFQVAANDARYQVYPFMDAWTNVFHSLGDRTTGTGGGSYLIAGPGWKKKDTPKGLTLIRSPSQLVWLIGRIQTNGVADYGVVHTLQDSMSLRPLSAYLTNEQYDCELLEWQQTKIKLPSPNQQIKDMSAFEFYSEFSQLTVANPASADDSTIMRNLAQVGLKPGSVEEVTLFTWVALAITKWATFEVLNYVVTRGTQTSNTHNGWTPTPTNLGNYGTDYTTRCAVAIVGLGACLAADATYYSTTTDSEGKSLHGSVCYNISFDKLPPAKAFWSITAYDMEHYLIANPIGRYAIGDRDALVLDENGKTVTIKIRSSTPPLSSSNWLPVQEGKSFQLTARVYWGDEGVLNQSYHMPPVQAVTC